MVAASRSPATPDELCYRDTYRERVDDLIERKRRGEEAISEGAPPEESNVTDLMEALRRSAEQLRARRPEKASAASRKGKKPGGKAPARKTASPRKAG